MPELETRLLIGGEQVAGDGDPLGVENPATEEGVATVPLPSDAQVDAAIAAAREASREWRRTPAVERGEMLHEVANRLRARTDELADAMTLEGGKPLIENSDEVGWTATAFDYYAEIGRDSAGRVIPSIEATQLSLIVKDPIGGFKQSGLGRELGREGLEAFQETKHVHIETEIAPKEWWYPYGEGS